MDYKEIYDKAFAKADYSNNDKELRYYFVLKHMKGKHYENIIDIGVGRGQLIKTVTNTYPFISTVGIDINRYSDFDFDKFYEMNLSTIALSDIDKIINDNMGRFDLLTCLDVLEHIDEKDIDNVLYFLSQLSDNFIFTIANHSDIVDGIELHLIQKDLKWWKKQLNKYYIINSEQTEFDGRLFLLELESK